MRYSTHSHDDLIAKIINKLTSNRTNGTVRELKKKIPIKFVFLNYFFLNLNIFFKKKLFFDIQNINIQKINFI